MPSEEGLITQQTPASGWEHDDEMTIIEVADEKNYKAMAATTS